jgi:ribose transport system ATP-binding protein
MGAILKTSHIFKTYPGVIALNDVSVEIEEGEIHGLIGENGAGKSTLIKTITGAVTPDSGIITVSGRDYKSLNPAASRKIGVEAVYQEFNLAPSLSVAENIFVGEKLSKGIFFNRKETNRRAAEILGMYDVDIDPSDLVQGLTVAKRQLVEIAKAVAGDAKLLIMDEPTAPLTDNEVATLFSIIRRLKEKGVTIIYISHRLEELFEITDRVTVMRDGEVIGTDRTEKLTKDSLISMMVGRNMNEAYPQKKVAPGADLLELRGVSGNGDRDISFMLREGEILGIAGLVGSGRTELARLIFGLDRKDGGEILIRGQKAAIKSPRRAIERGIGFLTEDRKTQGVLLSLSVRWNITAGILKKLSNAIGAVDSSKEKDVVSGLKDSLNIRTPSIEQLVKNLSGGNQQKVALAKWLASDSGILIFDEPTRGIDVGAKHEIYMLMKTLAEKGAGIILISSEMEEILGMSDRLIVLYEGRISGILKKEDFSQISVMKLASGETLKEAVAV